MVRIAPTAEVSAPPRTAPEPPPFAWSDAGRRVADGEPETAAAGDAVTARPSTSRPHIAAARSPRADNLVAAWTALERRNGGRLAKPTEDQIHDTRSSP